MNYIILLKKKISGLLKTLSILHYAVGFILIISLSGLIFGIISCLLGFILHRIIKDLQYVGDESIAFLKNFRIFLTLYLVIFVLLILFTIIGTIIFYIFGGLEGFYDII